MDSSQAALHQSLTFLAYASGIILILVGGFLTKLIIDLSKLSKNVDDTTTVVKTELKPTLKELNESLRAFNDFLRTTDRNIDKVKTTMGDVLGVSASALSKIGLVSNSLAKGVFKGFSTVMKMFCK